MLSAGRGAATPGCFPGPEAAQQTARRGGRRSHGVRGTQARQIADGCGLICIFFEGTLQSPEKTKTKQKAEKNRTALFSETYEGPRTNQRINVQTITYLDP